MGVFLAWPGESSCQHRHDDNISGPACAGAQPVRHSSFTDGSRENERMKSLYILIHFTPPKSDNFFQAAKP